jgi:hypothetical protein
VFRNVLTQHRHGGATFEITLGPGISRRARRSRFAPDGITPLPDTNGNGTPDTGVVAASERVIVVRAFSDLDAAGRLPDHQDRDLRARSGRTGFDDDRVEAVSIACRLVLDPT